MADNIYLTGIVLGLGGLFGYYCIGRVFSWLWWRDWS